MSDHAAGTVKPGHDTVRGALRFATELIAWIGAPWALWSHSVLLAILADVLLIGVPVVFSTPGDRPGGDAPVAVPGIVTILHLLLQLVAATASAWILWPAWAAVPVTLLCATVPFSEIPRWRSLMRATARPPHPHQLPTAAQGAVDRPES